MSSSSLSKTLCPGQGHLRLIGPLSWTRPMYIIRCSIVEFTKTLCPGQGLVVLLCSKMEMCHPLSWTWCARLRLLLHNV